MTKKIKRAQNIWMKMSFWERIERTLTTLGASAVFLESVFGAGAVATGITAAFTLGAQHLAIWIDDKNKDGVPDVFQEEETIIMVEVEKFSDNQE